MEKIENLTLEEKVGQMFMVGLGNVEYLKNIENLIIKYKIGGILLYKKDYKDYKELNNLVNRLRKIGNQNKIPLFIAIDQEGGRVNRMPNDFKNLPSAYKLASFDKEKLVDEASDITGEMLEKTGFNLNFAPVLDIKRFESTQAIGDRAFSKDFNIVTKCGLIYMDNMKKHNIVPVIKHYPGHGATKKDSHFTLPTIDDSDKKLEKEDLIPFKKAIENNADAILVGHLRIKNVTHGYPASMSISFVREYIRKSNRYNGLIITDDVRMKAVRILYGTKRSLYKAFKAGNDIVLFKYKNGDEKLIDKIINDVKDNNRKIAKINRSIRRILKVKEKYKIENEPISYIEGLPNEINTKIEEINNKIKGNVDG